VDLPVLAGFGADGRPDAAVAARVARAWLAGGIVGLPTETVYGLAADAQDESAVARIYRAKGRPADHPLIVHVSGPAALEGWAARHDEAASRLAEAFWPGPLTVIVARSIRAGDFITGGQSTVALRSPDHPVARACLAALAREAGDPARGVAAPSANRFGRVSPTRAADVVAEVGSQLDPSRDLVVDGGPCAVGVESTIVDCTVDPPRVLRLGAISQAQVDAALSGSARSEHRGVVGAASAPVGGRTPGVRAPGTLDSHYAPRAHVLLVDPAGSRPVHDPVRSETIEALELLRIMPAGAPERPLPGLIADAAVPTPEGWMRLGAPATAEEYARVLYAALRSADEHGLETVVAVLPDPGEGPLAVAVRDRLSRAAHRA
jgi:L-threonylcarbamoyladenylate synthase